MALDNFTLSLNLCPVSVEGGSYWVYQWSSAISSAWQGKILRVETFIVQTTVEENLFKHQVTCNMWYSLEACIAYHIAFCFNCENCRLCFLVIKTLCICQDLNPRLVCYGSRHCHSIHSVALSILSPSCIKDKLKATFSVLVTLPILGSRGNVFPWGYTHQHDLRMTNGAFPIPIRLLGCTE